jgi:hypothetical protein
LLSSFLLFFFSSLLGCEYFDNLNETWKLLLTAKKAIKQKISFLELNETSSKLNDPITLWLEKNRFSNTIIDTEMEEFSYISIGGNLQKLVDEG